MSRGHTISFFLNEIEKLNLMSDSTIFHEFIEELGTGDERAAQKVLNRFTHRLLALARNHLDGRLQQKVDAEDVLQSVYQSFFRRQKEGEFDFEDWDDLWGLLVTITVRKCCRQARHFTTDKRDLQREQSVASNEDSETVEWLLISREPTPEQSAQLTELIDQIMHPLDKQGQTIVMMRLQGYAEREISEEIKRSERTVRRTISRVRSQLMDSMG